MKYSLLFWLFLLPLLALTACVPEKVPGPGSSTTPTAAASGQGILKGSVTVGPLSPVQRAPEAGVPTETVSPDVYTSRSVNLYQADGTTLVQVIHFKGDGTYQVVLPPGQYVVGNPTGQTAIGGARNLPRPVQITAGQTTELNIDIDTGIR